VAKRIVLMLITIAFLMMLGGCSKQKEAEQSETVAFWKTTEEMSFEEAKSILKVKLARMEQHNSVGTLTDEERMALYVLGCNYYAEYIARYPSAEFSADSFWLSIELESDFFENVQEYLERNSWEKQSFAAEDAAKWNTVYTVDQAKSYQERTILLGSRYGYVADIDYVEVVHNRSGVRIEIDSTSKTVTSGEVTDFHRRILRHYLSLKSVAYIDGPIFPEIAGEVL